MPNSMWSAGYSTHITHPSRLKDLQHDVHPFSSRKITDIHEGVSVADKENCEEDLK